MKLKKVALIVTFLLVAALPLAAFAGDQAAITASGMPTCMTPGEQKTVSVTVFNSGTTVLTNGTYRLSYHWEGPMNVWDGIRTDLGSDVAVGSSKPVSAALKAADTHTSTNLPVGTYTVKWQMVHTGVGWFDYVATYPNIQVQASCGTLQPLDICRIHPEICHGWMRIEDKYRIKKRPEPDPRWRQYIDEIKVLNDRFLAAKTPAERKQLNDQANELGRKLNDAKFKLNGQSLKLQQLQQQQLNLR